MTLLNVCIAAGVISAIVDNIPSMYAILKMNCKIAIKNLAIFPKNQRLFWVDMRIDQWLLVTLAVGTGGSLLSIGSAAGVVVMGVNREVHTFTAHLKWMPAIALGYFASIWCWLLIADWFR